MSRREKRMETEVFKAVCPLEIGDTVAILSLIHI